MSCRYFIVTEVFYSIYNILTSLISDPLILNLSSLLKYCTGETPKRIRNIHKCIILPDPYFYLTRQNFNLKKGYEDQPCISP